MVVIALLIVSYLLKDTGLREGSLGYRSSLILKGSKSSHSTEIGSKPTDFGSARVCTAK